MAKKQNAIYVCSNCGAETTKWSGKCFDCGEWNTLQQQLTSVTVAGAAGKTGG